VSTVRPSAPWPDAEEDALLDVSDLSVVLTRDGRPPGRRTRDATLAVDRVSFTVRRGETLGIVGE
jgi:ABC-type glutathione transport system ATPase component